MRAKSDYCLHANLVFGLPKNRASKVRLLIHIALGIIIEGNLRCDYLEALCSLEGCNRPYLGAFGDGNNSNGSTDEYPPYRPANRSRLFR